jgi:transcriptional regulator with XRE-family HTH domain
MTPFGAKLREHRQARGLALKDMAGALGVTPTYLSALERGRRGPPPWYLVQRAIVYFNVIWDEAEELKEAAALSDPKVKVVTGGLPPAHTRLANELARDTGSLGASGRAVGAAAGGAAFHVSRGFQADAPAADSGKESIGQT